jgi:hypothetical protein
MTTMTRTPQTRLARITEDLLDARRGAINAQLGRYERLVAAAADRERRIVRWSARRRLISLAELHADLVVQLAKAQAHWTRRLTMAGPDPPRRPSRTPPV